MEGSVLDTVLTVLKRRGLTMLGASGASVSDDWVVTGLSLAVVLLNEVIQGREVHKVKKRKPAAKKIPPAI